MQAALPANEEARLSRLQRLDVAGKPRDPILDSIARVASIVCDTPIALLTLIERDVQWFGGKVGIAGDQTSRDVAFCAHAILRPNELLVVEDATADERFRENELVTGGPKIRFYAGAPLVTSDGYPLGTVCAIDRKPRGLTAEQAEALRGLAAQAVAVMEMRQLLRAAVQEFGDPLSPMRAQLQLLRPLAPGERAGRAIASLDQSLARMDLIARELRQERLLMADSEPLHPEVCDLGGLVKDAAAAVGPPRIGVDVPRHALPVNADARRLRAVLDQLSALSAAQEGAAGLRADSVAGMAIVETRLSPQLEALPELGLHASRAVVEAHGGTLATHATSTGKVLRLSLPLAR